MFFGVKIFACLSVYRDERLFCYSRLQLTINKIIMEVTTSCRVGNLIRGMFSKAADDGTVNQSPISDCPIYQSSP